MGLELPSQDTISMIHLQMNDNDRKKKNLKIICEKVVGVFEREAVQSFNVNNTNS